MNASLRAEVQLTDQGEVPGRGPEVHKSGYAALAKKRRVRPGATIHQPGPLYFEEARRGRREEQLKLDGNRAATLACQCIGEVNTQHRWRAAKRAAERVKVAAGIYRKRA